MTGAQRGSTAVLVALVLLGASLAGLASGPLLAAERQAGGTRFELERTHVLSEKGSSRGSAYIESNKVVTLDGKVHVAWLDAGLGGKEPARVRTLDLASGEWSRVYSLGEATDNHGSPAIVPDSRGYLHSVFGGHGSVWYQRSLRPNDASEWTEPRLLCRGTYPSLVCDPADTLHLTLRQNRELVYYRRAAGGEWSERRPLVKPIIGGYTCYRASLFIEVASNRLHLGFMLFGGERFKDAQEKGLVGYMRSDDWGDTWAQFDGTVINTPTEAGFERLPVTDNCVRVSNLVVDSDGTPYIVAASTGFRGYHDKWGEATLWKRDGDGWHPTPLTPLIKKVYPEHRASWAEPSLTFDDTGNLYIAMVAVDQNQVDPRSKWINEATSIYGHVSSKMVVAVSTDRGQTFELLPMQDFGSVASSWLPSFERFTGHNRVTSPGLIYTQGLPGRGLRPKDVVSQVLFYRFRQTKQ